MSRERNLVGFSNRHDTNQSAMSWRSRFKTEAAFGAKDLTSNASSAYM